ncbi:hypothetical protein TSUD_43840 [Trifolium subterraneum]|uniref:F-box domain-containing protein n=1 Tax=Trifolium subterraneum TaxID=3900 RepID=A0A2Z6N6C3_TRISU|nr:hypothetical protein TSUD_43840 [Trifolium subterraneum]
MKIPQRNNKSSSRVLRYDPYALAFLKAIQVTFKDKKENHNEIVKLLKDFKARGNSSTKRMKELLKGHTNLILLFNTFMPKERRITLSSQLETKGRKVNKVEENCELPCDVLDIIIKKLDFDDLFQFAGVSRNWRAFHKIYWTNFLASQKPLISQFSMGCLKRFFSFISIPEQKVYCFKMKYSGSYVMFSSGYFIMMRGGHSFMLINPFTRTMKVIPSEVKGYLTLKCALLAFDKCSEEFVLVVLCGSHLNVYQSRNCGWVIYPIRENLGRIVDAVVLHNIIYVITNRAKIGVLNLNSSNIKYLKLKSTPNVIASNLNLVNCDEQLLVVDFKSKSIKNVYKIDFSTMNYVKLETLGDIALFHAWNPFKSKCYALSNPNRWGYESNSMYVLNKDSTICSVYTMDDKKLQKCITLPAPSGTSFSELDWCFRHLRYEVDYSLVE